MGYASKVKLILLSGIQHRVLGIQLQYMLAFNLMLTSIIDSHADFKAGTYSNCLCNISLVASWITSSDEGQEPAWMRCSLTYNSHANCYNIIQQFCSTSSQFNVQFKSSSSLESISRNRQCNIQIYHFVQSAPNLTATCSQMNPHSRAQSIYVGLTPYDMPKLIIASAK